MCERKYADAYDMNMKKICNMILYQISDNEELCCFCKEDEERADELTARLNNTALDTNFKKEFANSLEDTINYASWNSFENGLRIGLSLLKNLLTAKPPEINVIHKETPIKKDEFIEDFSRIYENLPFRERMYLMRMIYEYEEKYNEKNTFTEDEET